MSGRLRAIDAFAARASAKTVWVFVRATGDEGHIGWGEATWSGHESELAAAFARLLPAELGAPAEPRDGAPPAGDFADAAIRSALDQALWDIAARKTGRPLREALGPDLRDSIALYANVNRRTIDRSPDGFAASAARAVASGFDTIKIAPFDGVVPGGSEGVALGLARVAAARAAIGPARALYVDCHWRFDEAGAAAILDPLSRIGIAWFECPIAEAPSAIPALKRLRARANGAGAVLAGCEMEVGLAGVRPYIDQGAYDVVMPDAKYAGGLAEFRRIAAHAAAHGVAVAPHNPSGPICHLASVHLCAGLQGFRILEHQYDESPVFDAIADRAIPRARAGALALPDGPGLGAALDPAKLVPLEAFLAGEEKKRA
jgi:galactonate dehydratase